MKSEKKYACRGLQCVSPSKRKKIAALGARALHDQGLANKFTTKTAKAAALKRAKKNETH